MCVCVRSVDAIVSKSISSFSCFYENRHIKPINIRTKRRLIYMSECFFFELLWKSRWWAKQKKSWVKMNDYYWEKRTCTALSCNNDHAIWVFGIVKLAFCFLWFIIHILPSLTLSTRSTCCKNDYMYSVHGITASEIEMFALNWLIFAH